MFLKFLISNLRLLVRRFKSVAVINVVGLAVAFAVMLVVAMQAHYDLTYDRSYKNSRDIFISEVGWVGWEFDEYMNYELPGLWKERIPEIRSYCVSNRSNIAQRTMQIEGRGSESTGHDVIIKGVSPGFLDVFTPGIVTGDASGAFDAPGRCIIPEKLAATIFGGESPVGHVLVEANNPEKRYIVDAVYRDFPANSSLGNDLYTQAAQTQQSQYNYLAYFVIDPADRDAVLAKMNDSTLVRDADPERFYAGERYALTNLAEFYLHGGAEGGGHLGLTLYLLVIGALILVVAIINFINLSMAMAPSRVRNVNIHRILGIGRLRLRSSLSMEAAVMAVVAVAAGCLLVHWFSTSVFTDFFTADLTLYRNIPLIAVCAAVLLLVAFLVGIHSSRYATSFDVAIALKSSFALSRQGAGLRNTLVVVQFTAAILFICFSWFVKVQYNYMSGYEVGYERENIVYVPALADSIAQASFRQELMKNPAITDYTLAMTPGYLNSIQGNEFEGKEVVYVSWFGDSNMLRFFGVEIVAGENFSPDSGLEQIILNREFMRKYDFGEDIIGKNFSGFTTVAGIAEDINFASLHEPIKPMAFITYNGWSAAEVFIKISGSDVPATLDFIEKTWRELAPTDGTEYSLTFLYEQIDALYKRELDTSRLIGILGAMAVAIAVMGVFGLIMLNTRYRTKEIAIRKVNGATIGGVALMLNRGMLILVGVALVVAVPLTLVFITRWVAGFAYKAPLPWWLFPAGGALVLIIAVATVSLQSWRAASANPVNSLKSE